MPVRTATYIGFIAILLWSLLALFTIGAAPVPPFQLNAMTFALGGLIGLIWTLRQGITILRQVPMAAYIWGTLGLFGYHVLYFTAFRIGPSAETGLVAYLWPLLIVMFSGLLPGERLTKGHVFGACIAFCGAALLVLDKGQGGAATPMLALVLALGCAVVWASYSVISRRFGDIPTQSVTVFCLATAFLSVPLHFAFEITHWPTNTFGWLSILALGIGPVGIAFFTWDIGVKKGDIQLLGTASYAAPVLSTLALIAAGYAKFSPTLVLAALMIAGGAYLASRKKA